MMFKKFLESSKLCPLCLSFDRKMRLITNIKQLFLDYLKFEPICDVICWECEARIKSIELFITNATNNNRIISNYAENHSEMKLKDLKNYCTSKLQINLPIILKIEHESDEEESSINPLQIYTNSPETKDEIDNIVNSSDSDDKSLLFIKEKQEQTGKKKKHLIKKNANILNLEDGERILLRQKDLNDVGFRKWKHKCFDCVYGNTNEQTFTKHMAKHNEVNGKECCDICNLKFESKSTLEKHRRNHYKAYECKSCEYRTTVKGHMIEHLRQSSKSSCQSDIENKMADSEFRCDVCDIVFKSRGSRDYHMKTRHSEKPRCDCCNKEFATKQNLKDHLDGYKRMRKRQTQCKICLKWFTRKTNYRDHVKSHETVKEYYVCDICGKNFLWKTNMLRHMNQHLSKETGKYKCVPCGRVYSSLETFKQHNAYTAVHGPNPVFNIRKIKKYGCDVCEKKFLLKSQLDDHVDWEHKKIMKHKCDKCSGVFRSSVSLRQHLRIHMNTTENLCHYCGKAYKNEMTLRVHILNKHKSASNTSTVNRQSGNRVRCSLCQVTCATQSNLHRHMRAKHGDTQE